MLFSFSFGPIVSIDFTVCSLTAGLVSENPVHTGGNTDLLTIFSSSGSTNFSTFFKRWTRVARSDELKACTMTGTIREL